MWLKRTAITFSFPQCSTSRKCLFLYLALMWQTVCLVISAKEMQCLFWYVLLGGGRIAQRMRKRRTRGWGVWGVCVRGRKMSIHEEGLSEQVVYTWQTLIIIIIIIISKGHSKQSGYLSKAADPCCENQSGQQCLQVWRVEECGWKHKDKKSK